MKSKKFESIALFLFAVSIFASGINYLFQIISGRLLNQVEYGTLNSVFSIINILTIFGVAVGLSITKDFANSSNVKGKIDYLLKLFACLSVPFIAIVAFAMRILNFQISVCIFSAIAIFLISSTYIYYGMFQGTKMFLHLSIFNLIQPVIKLSLGIGLILLGLKINAAPIAMIFGALICIIYGHIISCKKFEKSSADFSDIKPILSYMVFTLISTVCVTVFNNIDILIVRSYFSEYDVGIYSCSALFGKVLMYIPTALTVLLVPVAAQNNSEGKIALRKSLIYSFLLSSIAGSGLYILRKPIITIIMGNSYLPAEKYIFPICITIIPLVLATVLINYLIAVGDKIFVSISSLSALAIMLISVMFIHSSIITILLVLAFVYILLTLILFIRSKNVCPKKI